MATISRDQASSLVGERRALVTGWGRKGVERVGWGDKRMDGVDRRLWGAADAGRTKGVREGKCIGTENVSVAEDAFAGRRTTRCSCEQPPPSLLPAFYSLFLFFTFSPFFFFVGTGLATDEILLSSVNNTRSRAAKNGKT